jgi:DNA-directed RNA polymerase subunit N (RpoN/RPB10)
MIYMSCPTCGYLLGSKAEEFEKRKKIVCDNEKLSDEEKETKIQQIIKDLKFRRYCCSMRVMTCKNIVEDIIPVEN